MATGYKLSNKDGVLLGTYKEYQNGYRPTTITKAGQAEGLTTNDIQNLSLQGGRYFADQEILRKEMFVPDDKLLKEAPEKLISE